MSRGFYQRLENYVNEEASQIEKKCGVIRKEVEEKKRKLTVMEKELADVRKVVKNFRKRLVFILFTEGVGGGRLGGGQRIVSPH